MIESIPSYSHSPYQIFERRPTLMTQKIIAVAVVAFACLSMIAASLPPLEVAFIGLVITAAVLTIRDFAWGKRVPLLHSRDLFPLITPINYQVPIFVPGNQRPLRASVISNALCFRGGGERVRVGGGHVFRSSVSGSQCRTRGHVERLRVPVGSRA